MNGNEFKQFAAFKEEPQNNLVVVNYSTLKDMIKHVITEAITSNMSEVKHEQPAEAELLSILDLVKLLKISKTTIHNWKIKRLIKGHRIGRRVFFEKSEIMEALILQKYTVEPF